MVVSRFFALKAERKQTKSESQDGLEWTMRATLSLVLACAMVGASAKAANDVLTPQLGNAFTRKVVVVQEHSDVQQRSTNGAIKPRSTMFTQAETNSYLKFNAKDLLPTGMTEPQITLIGQGRLSGKAIIDLDVVRQKSSSGGWFDPTSYLTGKLPVTASGRVITGDGKARFVVERAEVSGIPLPQAFLAQMVNFFTRTADNPKGSSIDDTFDMPAQIQRIDVDAARFTVHQ
jgi:hypothetical protein